MEYLEYRISLNLYLFSVIIPLYNEEKSLPDLLQKLENCDFVKDKELYSFIFVNDGSNDKTFNILSSHKKKSLNKFEYIHNKNNCGYGSAIRLGAHQAKEKSKYIIFIDSDLTNPIEHIKFFKRLMHKDIDLIKSTRFHPDGGLKNIPLKRRFFTFFGNKLSNICFRLDIDDYTNGFRAIKTDVFIKLKLK